MLQEGVRQPVPYSAQRLLQTRLLSVSRRRKPCGLACVVSLHTTWRPLYNLKQAPMREVRTSKHRPRHGLLQAAVVDIRLCGQATLPFRRMQATRLKSKNPQWLFVALLSWVSVNRVSYPPRCFSLRCCLCRLPLQGNIWPLDGGERLRAATSRRPDNVHTPGQVPFLAAASAKV